MPSFTSKEIIDKIIAGEGRYEDDPQAIQVCSYTTPEGGTAFHVAYNAQDIHALNTSPYVREIKTIWRLRNSELRRQTLRQRLEILLRGVENSKLWISRDDVAAQIRALLWIHESEDNSEAPARKEHFKTAVPPEEDYPDNDIRRFRLIENAVRAGDQILMDGADGSPEELAFLTAAVAKEWAGKVECAARAKLFGKDLMGSK